MTTLTSDRVQTATDRPATDRLVAAFAATDTVAYFDCFSPAATFVFHPEQTRLDDRAAYEAVWASQLEDRILTVHEHLSPVPA